MRKILLFLGVAVLATGCDPDLSQNPESPSSATQSREASSNSSLYTPVDLQVPNFVGSGAMPFKLSRDYPVIGVSLFDARLNLDLATDAVTVHVSPIGRSGDPDLCVDLKKVVEHFHGALDGADLCIIPGTSSPDGTLNNCSLVALGAYAQISSSDLSSSISIGSQYLTSDPSLGCHPTVDFCDPKRREFLKLLLHTYAQAKFSCR